LWLVGCGKTEVARRMAQLSDAPFIKVEGTDDESSMFAVSQSLRQSLTSVTVDDSHQVH
jgi:ATP-dependent protease HslVU (ClpYQ) ATPase subunit